MKTVSHLPRLIIMICLALLWSPVNMAAHSPAYLDRSPQSLYQKFCSACHGENGNGKSKAAPALSSRPMNFHSPEAKKKLSRKRMIQSVTNGRPDTAMTGWGKRFSPAEIEAIVDYIRESFMQIPAKQSDLPHTDIN